MRKKELVTEKAVVGHSGIIIFCQRHVLSETRRTQGNEALFTGRHSCFYFSPSLTPSAECNQRGQAPQSPQQAPRALFADRTSLWDAKGDAYDSGQRATWPVRSARLARCALVTAVTPASAGVLGFSRVRMQCTQCSRCSRSPSGFS